LGKAAAIGYRFNLFLVGPAPLGFGFSGTGWR